MCDVCRAVPETFIVLSGDDALTLPLMAVGGHGIISVASNEVPAEMSQMVELAERNDFAAARKLHHDLLPLMTVNFIESNPIPVKSAMAAMGLLEEHYRLPMVPPREPSRQKIREVINAFQNRSKSSGAASRASVQHDGAVGRNREAVGRGRKRRSRCCPGGVRQAALCAVGGRGACRGT